MEKKDSAAPSNPGAPAAPEQQPATKTEQSAPPQSSPDSQPAPVVSPTVSPVEVKKDEKKEDDKKETGRRWSEHKLEEVMEYNLWDEERDALVFAGDPKRNVTLQQASNIIYKVQQINAQRSTQSARELFEILDEDEDGIISASHLHYLLTTLGKKLDPKEMDAFFAEVGIKDDKMDLIAFNNLIAAPPAIS